MYKDDLLLMDYDKNSDSYNSDVLIKINSLSLNFEVILLNV